jgi:hypothetical protein
MKRFLFVAMALAASLMAGNLLAKETAAPKAVRPDWHYRWHEGRWWYWMPESSNWMVWTNSAWVPYEQFAACPQVLPVSQTNARSTGQVSEARTESVAAQPAYTSGSNCPTNYSAPTSSGYAGYGWSWGSGTAFRDSPGRRF